MNHVISTKEFSRKFIDRLFRIADSLNFKNDNTKILRNKVMASLFYEPSTRTRFSFELAMLKLGGHVISTENAKEFSSVAKGETLEDTIRVVNSYADVIVLRHFEKGSAKKASLVSRVPVINAGDGPGEHPTQALLDLYTIYKKFKKIDGLSIALCGDLKYSRTLHSLVYILSLYKNIKFYLVSPPQLRLPRELKNYMDSQGMSYEELNAIGPIISKAHIFSQTRVQKERFSKVSHYEKVKNSVVISPELISKMRKDAIIMHPLPRNDEIPVEIDNDPRAVYFDQIGHGLLIRAALLKLILTNKKPRI